MILRHCFFIFHLIIFGPGLLAQYVTTSDITAGDIREHILFLAADEREGRYPGTPGSDAAARYIRDRFTEAGLTLAGNDGFQEFELVVSLKAGGNNRLNAGGYQAVLDQDFMPFSFSRSGSLTAACVFAGYGFDISQDSLVWNDYEGLDVRGKWVVILRGDPEMDKQESRFAPYGEDRDKVLTARDKGAGGVLLVSGREFDPKDRLTGLYYDKTQSNAGLPVIHITRETANRLFSEDNRRIEALDSLIMAHAGPQSMEMSATVNASVEIVYERVTGRNVVAWVEGSDPLLKNSFVIIGAHYDHLGMGGTGSGSRFLDSMAVHNGADDNASGVAGVLELAAKFAADRSSLNRSVFFIAFDAEEMGLIGSRYFVDNPLIDLRSVVAMINFDMIGRLKVDNPSILIGGMGTAKESVSIVESLDSGPIQVNFSPDGYGPSDHAAFYGEEIPVFFITTGPHEDYHTPDDDWDRINFEGQEQVLKIAEQLARALAARDEALTFTEAGPKEPGQRTGYRFKVTLGIMPDFAAIEGGGLGVGGVKKDGPAYKGGMQKGDVIKAIDGRDVNDIYDYMNRLQKLKPGQVLAVDVMREGQKMVLIIQL